jgi:hypothetical protein
MQPNDMLNGLFIIIISDNFRSECEHECQVIAQYSSSHNIAGPKPTLLYAMAPGIGSQFVNV